MLTIRAVTGVGLLLLLLAPASVAAADETDSLTIVGAPGTIAYGTPWTIDVVVNGTAVVDIGGSILAEGTDSLGAVVTPDGGAALEFAPTYTLPVGTWDVRVKANAIDAGGELVVLESTNSVEITVTPVNVTPQVSVVKSGESVAVTAGLPTLIPHVADAGSWHITFSTEGQIVHSISRVGLESGPLTVEWYPPLPGTEFDVTVVWQPLSPSVIAAPVTQSFVSNGIRPTATPRPTPTRSATPTASSTPTPTRSSSPVPNPSGTTSASPTATTSSPLPLVLGLVAALIGIAAAVVGILYVRRRAASASAAPETVNADQLES